MKFMIKFMKAKYVQAFFEVGLIFTIISAVAAAALTGGIPGIG